MRARVQPNLIDRLVGFLHPEAGARRMYFRHQMAIAGGYLGARKDRRATKEWRLANNSADVDILSDLATLRDRSRDLVRNAPLATGAIGTVVQNVVGSGLSLQSKPDWEFLKMSEQEADDWTAQVEREFSLWAESVDCDITQSQNFYGLQNLVFRSSLESGDVLILLPMIARRSNPYELTLQIIEADRLETPIGLREEARTKEGRRIAGGVETDENGAPLAYHILRTHPGSLEGKRSESDRILAWGEQTGRRNAIHVFERLRPGQSRGVPYLSPVIELIKQIDKYTEAEVTAAVLSSLITTFVQTETGEGFASPAGTPATEAEQEIKLGTGGIVDLRPGESISSFSPNRPNTAFDAFLQSVLRQIGVALGIPFEVLIKHFTASYSAARAALLESWKFFRGRRAFLAQSFCAPVFEVWMIEAVAKGRLQAPGFFEDPALRRAYLMAEWIGDAPGQIDPVKEVTAAEKRVALEVSTLEDETLQLTGKQWSDVHRQRIKERRLQRRDGTEQMASNPDGKPAETPVDQPTEDERQERGDLENRQVAVA